MQDRSIWHSTARLPEFPPLEGDKRTELLIIGGGMTGLLCAHRLAGAGADCTLVEAGRLCGGTTGNTSAKLTAQHGLIYQRLIRQWGTEKARLYLEANRKALEQYRTLCRDIDCDYQERDAYLFAPEDPAPLEAEQAALAQLGVEAPILRPEELPMECAGAIRFARQAQFHPLRFAAGIAGQLKESRKVKIHEHTPVLRMGPGWAETPTGRIRAKTILVASHFPFWNGRGWYFLKMYQQRSYLLALEGAPLPEGMYLDPSPEGLSLRSWQGMLLLGGGGHRTGKSGGGWLALEQAVRQYYPGARVRGRWAAQDCMTLDGVPYIGRYAGHLPGVYVATGFNKWGMSSAMAAALLLTDLSQGRKNPYEELFDPGRSILHPQLAVNGWEAVRSLLTPRPPRCSHLGCALHWNPQEHTWDCPCHGSRFGLDDRLLEGPATRPLHRHKK